MSEISISAPLSDEVVKGLRSGDKVLIDGIIYTGRDAAHKRLVALLERGQSLPFALAGQIIYFVGPTPARPGRAVGSAGPTTSYRMDAYSPRLISRGLKGMIGKGARSKDVIEAMKQYKCVYMAAVGGAGALIAQSIKKSEVIAYEDLGPEAIRRMEVENFPAVVVNDVLGNDLYREGVQRYRK